MEDRQTANAHRLSQASIRLVRSFRSECALATLVMLICTESIEAYICIVWGTSEESWLEGGILSSTRELVKYYVHAGAGSRP